MAWSESLETANGQINTHQPIANMDRANNNRGTLTIDNTPASVDPATRSEQRALYLRYSR